MTYVKQRIMSFVPDPIRRDFKSMDDLNSLIKEHFSTPAKALLFFDHEFQWAKWTGESFQYSLEDRPHDVRTLQLLRVFNPESELFIRRLEMNQWVCRFRQDGEGEEVDVIDATQYLLGTSQGETGDYSKLWESSGTAGRVPLVLPKGKRAVLQTRNYIGYAGGVLANFEDSRFVSVEEAI